MEKLYFDYCASTPLYPEVFQIFIDSTKSLYMNPSSTHILGQNIKNLVDKSRQDISDLLDIKPSEVIFTSGATESNNIAIIGLIHSMKKSFNKEPHIILSDTEHSSVYNCCKKLEAEGVEVTYLPVNENGLVSINDVRNSIKDNTVLISIMHVNNETGSTQPIQEIGNLVKNKSEIYFHVDGVQAVGKLPLNLEFIDLYTISGHKIGAPKGIGALVVKEHVPISPILFGGNQENGIRPGTTNVPGVLSLTEALKISITKQGNRWRHLTNLHNMLDEFVRSVPELSVNSPKNGDCSPHIYNFSYKGIPSAILLSILEKRGIIASSQSACSSYKQTSRVLMAMNGDFEISSSSVRISFHESTRLKDMEYLVNSIKYMVSRVKSNRFI